MSRQPLRLFAGQKVDMVTNNALALRFLMAQSQDNYARIHISRLDVRMAEARTQKRARPRELWKHGFKSPVRD